MAFFVVIHDWDDDTREVGAELARAEPEHVGAALQRVRPGHAEVIARVQLLLDSAPGYVMSIDDPQILMSRQLLLAAEELSVQFSAYDDVAKEAARYAHLGRPEDPIRYSD